MFQIYYKNKIFYFIVQIIKMKKYYLSKFYISFNILFYLNQIKNIKILNI